MRQNITQKQKDQTKKDQKAYKKQLKKTSPTSSLLTPVGHLASEVLRRKGGAILESQAEVGVFLAESAAVFPEKSKIAMKLISLSNIY